MTHDGAEPVRRVTHADVARASGVSRATVSYVLNRAEGRSISAATRDLVLETAKRLGHVPYAPARSLRLGRSNIVLALVRDYTLGYVSSGVLRRLDMALAERGFILLAHRYEPDARPLEELWGLVTPSLVVAMGGLSVPHQQAIEGTNTRVLRVHGFVPNEKVGRMQADYLAGRGHRLLGYAFPSDPTLSLVATERLQGIVKECKDLGLPEPDVRTIDIGDPASTFAALDAWLSEGVGVTAIASHNDEIAMSLSTGMTMRGLRAGTDLALIGVDDIPLARLSLTTIAIDIDAWADAVARSVMALLDGDEPGPVDDDFLRLIPRDSA